MHGQRVSKRVGDRTNCPHCKKMHRMESTNCFLAGLSRLLRCLQTFHVANHSANTNAPRISLRNEKQKNCYGCQCIATKKSQASHKFSTIDEKTHFGNTMYEYCNTIKSDAIS